MLKSFLEFLVTGAMVVVGYTLYFISMFIITILLGLPIVYGIKIIIDIINVFFGGIQNANL